MIGNCSANPRVCAPPRNRARYGVPGRYRSELWEPLDIETDGFCFDSGINFWRFPYFLGMFLRMASAVSGSFA